LIRRLLTLLAALGIASAAVAGDPPRPGWTKMIVLSSSAQTLEVMHQFATFVDLEQYEAMSMIYVPIGEVAAVRRAAADRQIRVEDADYFDIIEFSTASFDTRYPLRVPPNGRPAAIYAAGEYGLYAVQFHAALKPFWLRELQDIGAVYYTPMAHSVTLFGATPELSRRILSLPYVQWVEPLHPFFKYSPPVRNPQVLVYAEIVFACIPGSEAACERVKRSLRSVDGDAGCGGGKARLFGVASASALERALTEPSVVSVSQYGDVINPAEIPVMSGSPLALIAATLAIISVVALRRR
jgi:hypothetical protein